MHLFEDENDFIKQYGNGWLYKEPWVSAIKNYQGTSVDKPAAFNFKPEEKPFNVGDIILSDSEGLTYSCPYTEYYASAWTGYNVDGVVCIPEYFLPDGYARMMALYDVNANGEAVQLHSASMSWGSESEETDLPYYSAATMFNNVSLVWTSSTNVNYVDVPYGMLAEQAWTSPSSKNHVDYNDRWCRYNFGKYQSHVTGISSPYNLDGTFNEKWVESVTGGNMLSDFEGSSKTYQLVANLGTSFNAANACWNYESSDAYPANTWYLPTLAEFVAAHARSAHVMAALQKLGVGGVYYNVDSDVGEMYYWTSTEYNLGKAYAYRTWDDDDETGDDIVPLSKSTNELIVGEDDDLLGGPFVRPFAIPHHNILN